MMLSEMIQEDVVRVGLAARNKWEAIEELVDVLIAAHELRLANRAEVIEAVKTREKSFSTGLNHGLAVPHGAVECVKELVAALGTSADGIPFESVDETPAHLVILLVIPRDQFPQHMRTLAGVSGLANRDALRTRIISASSAREVIDALQELEDL
jgi:PTS system fructose-specific IIC component